MTGIGNTCNICGSDSSFHCLEGFTLRESICNRCGVSRRTSDLAGIILQTFCSGFKIPLSCGLQYLARLSIFEAESTGILHDYLEVLPHFICSEYYDDMKPGTVNTDGIRCEDLRQTTFPDSCFDLIVTQDVLEHVSNPHAAFEEIFRILRPGGYHIFTVPYHEGWKTRTRINGSGNDERDRLPRIFHYDRLRKEGAPVYTDFGSDLVAILEGYGFLTDSICCSVWYECHELPDVHDKSSYESYLRYYNENNLCRYFKYNSWVFRSRKPELRW
jgi:SAM-dependent methyltransferase